MRFFSQKKLYNKKKNSGVTRKNEKKITMGNKIFLFAPSPIYIKKGNLKAKEEFWKFKYFTMQKYNLLNNPLKETKIHQDIITL